MIKRSTIVPPQACGATHRHYKGGWYRVLHQATHTETGEAMVVYEHLWPHENRVFVRPALLFYGTVGVEPNIKLRFEPVED